MIRFDFTLRGAGWGGAVVANERAKVSVSASYLTDAFRDFADAVQRLFTEEDTECVWEIEPGEFRWKFRRVGPDCAVEVFQNDRVQAIFSGSDDLLHFSSQVDISLRKLLDDFGEERYLRERDHSFPREVHAKLRRTIEDERKVRALNSEGSK